MSKNEKRGGARQGAGRKAVAGVKRVPLSARVLPSTLARLKKLGEEQKKSLGEVLDEMAGPEQKDN